MRLYLENGDIQEFDDFRSLERIIASTPLIYREDNPSIEYDDGSKYWYKNGKIHRVSGPAIEDPKFGNYWLVNGKLHREDGPAIEYVGGIKHWYRNGKLHREDGPAVEFGKSSRRHYYIEGVEGSVRIMRKILNYKRKSSLTQYLLSNNVCYRFYAEKRLKELKKEA